MANWRSYILKAMLASLGLTALAGVAAVLVSGDVVWRVAGTGLVTAVACLLMLRLSTMADQPPTASAAVVGMAGAAAGFVLFLAVLWRLHRLLPGAWDESELLGTGGILVLCVLPAMSFMKMLHKEATRIAAVAGLFMIGVAGATALTGVWIPQGGNSPEALCLWGTAGTIAGIGFLVVAALVGLTVGDRRYWRWIGVVAAVLAGVAAGAEIWSDSFVEPDHINILVTIAIMVACANLICRIDLRPQQQLLRLGTLGAGAVAAVLWMIAFSLESEDLMRVDAAFLIPAGCGALALAVVDRLNRRTAAVALPRELAVITVFCPRCRRKQTLQLGGDTCKSCHLRIEVRAQAPACAKCGYLLYALTSDRCPECGEPISTPAPAVAA